LPDIEFDFIPRLRIDIPRFEISDVKKDVAAATVRLDKSEAPISHERLDYATHFLTFLFFGLNLITPPAAAPAS
jgi:hypothetical protein